ncbi:MAG: hypothetical protein RML40_01635 [Bacteroidota bacterium]|nr:hypothetical protein [Candidatus Kapabacteria bacterium]MDW8219210.1 hypothetical protein [Bacteroidota bacterium]
MKPIELFKQYIQGDLDNREQIEEERRAGKQIHPYAKHVNRLADDKILNKPAHYQGFYILEESYYVYPDKPNDTIIKPYLFWFTEENGAVKLHSLQIPKDIPVHEIRNDNPTLRFDYNALRLSPTFKPACYTFNEASQSFYIKAVNEFPGGSFTLEETIANDSFSVMELLIKDGKQITPYSMPIIYKRINKR